MNPEQFLRLVVPWSDQGFAVICWKRPEKRGFIQKSCKTIEAALAQVDRVAGKGFDIYFALSQQRFANDTRTRADALWMGSVFIDGDIDPNDPACFPSLEEAISSIIAFCRNLKIPDPSLIVHSGGGIHVYWLSDKYLDVEDWQQFADQMMAALQHSKIKVKDIGLTGDAARVLRVPGTLNYKSKYGSPSPVVRVLDKYSTLEKHDFSIVFEPLKQFAPIKKTPKSKLPPPSAMFAHLKVGGLAAGIEDQLVPFAPIKAGCAWLREAHDTGGKEFNEPQWNLTTLCAIFMENGHDLAHQFGNQHPTYSIESTEDKWQHKIGSHRNSGVGWPQCRTISRDGSRHCQSCPHLDLDKSPLNLALQFTEPDEPDADQKDNQKEFEEVGGTRPEALRLPEGFAVDEKGQICAFIEAQETSRGKVKSAARLLCLLKTLIKDPSLQYQNGQFGLGFVSCTDRDNWQEIFLGASNFPLPALTNFLFGKSVLPNMEGEAPKMLQKLAISWLDKLLTEDLATRDSGTMGWRYKDGEKVGFVYGNVFYHQDGSQSQMVPSTDDEFRSWYLPVGKKEVWLKACKLLTDRKRPELDILIAIGFAAPLTAFGGALYGATLSMWGDPGTSKSTAQQVAAAIFGHPKQTRESLNSTPKSIQGRLGRTRNLAAYWDDIQNEQHQDNLFTTMFVAAGGLEGGRLNQDASMKERKEWQTLLVACSNASFIEYLTKKQKSTTAGMRRVFEIQFSKHPNEPGMIDAVDASLCFAALEHNYGVIGAEYAGLLAKGHKEIAELVALETKKFKNAVSGVGDESFWWGLCGVLLMGAKLARKLGAELDVEAMDRFLRVAFHSNRTIRKTEGTEGGTKEHTLQALSHFVNEYVNHGNIIYINRQYRFRHASINIISHPLQKEKLLAQVARDERKIFISKKALVDYLQKNDIHNRQVFDGFKRDLGAKEIKLTLGAGTPYGGAQESCFEFFVPIGQPDHVLLELLCLRGQPVPLLDDANEADEAGINPEV